MCAQITLQSIADRLGCSAKTVSNAFNRPDQLSSATRERVLAVAAELGYPGPNPLAAGLRRGRVGAIGFAYANPLSYAFEDPVSVALLAGISAVAEGEGAGLLLVPGSADGERSAAAITAAVIDGLLIFSMADDDPLVNAAIARRLPTVVVDEPEPAALAGRGGPAPCWVGVDDAAGARLAAQHLLDLGHERIAVITFSLYRGQERGRMGESEQAAATYAVSRRRLEGYRRAITAAGLDWSAVPVMAGVTSSVEEGAAAAAAVLELGPPPTAVLCLSDRLAEGAVRELRRRGLDVPGDVSVVGFDDADTAAGLGLTTVRQPHRGKGERATEALLALMAGQTVAPVQVLETKLVVRGSAGPPAPARGARQAGARLRSGAMAELSRRPPDTGWLARAPSAGLVIGGITSVQIGGALAVHLFRWVGPGGAVLLRMVTAALILLATSPPRLRGRALRGLPLAVVFGLVLAGMTLCFYNALHRVPLGIAVALEFVGPLSVAVAGSRRPVDLVWVVLAVAGILALTRGGGEPISGLGVFFALMAGALWGCYILLSARVGRAFERGAGLTVALCVAALVTLPVGVAAAGSRLLEPRSLALGAAIGLLSSAIPFSFEMEALRRIPAPLFGVLMSLEPAMAALAGFVILGQQLSARAVLGIALVVAASAGASMRGRRAPTDI